MTLEKSLERATFYKFLLDNGGNEDCLKFANAHFEQDVYYEALRSAFTHRPFIVINRLLSEFRKGKDVNKKYVTEQIVSLKDIINNPEKYVDSYYAECRKMAA